MSTEQDEMAFRENVQRFLWLLVKEYPADATTKIMGMIDQAVRMKASPIDTMWCVTDALCERLATDVVSVENCRVEEPARPAPTTPQPPSRKETTLNELLAASEAGRKAARDDHSAVDEIFKKHEAREAAIRREIRRQRWFWWLP